MEISEAMHAMSSCMDLLHPLWVDELHNVLLDKDLDTEDATWSSREQQLQLVLQSKCFQSECTWAGVLARLGLAFVWRQ